MSTIGGDLFTPLREPSDASDDEALMARLLYRLEERAPLVELFTDYYEGRHRLSFVSSPYRAAFGQMLGGISDNWCELVIQSAVERLEVQSFIVGAGDRPDLDTDALNIWRRDGLELDATLAFTEAAKIGESYLLVSRDRVTGASHISVEHPRQFIVERHPANRRRITAALKAWFDEDADALFLVLWTPERIVRRARRRNTEWFEPRGTDDPNPFGEVPVAVLVNDPQMIPAYPPLSLLLAPHNAPNVPIGLGRSDLSDIIATSDAIDQLLSNMLVAAEFSAFRQRWATGLEVPRDSQTGEMVEPFRAAVDRVWASSNPDTRFGEFAPAELTNYIGAIQWLVQSIASRTRIPPHILMSGSGNWPSGESLRAAESGLVSKARAKIRSFSPAISYAISLAMRLEGEDAPVIAIDWLDVERRMESTFADSLVKKLAIGVPPQQLWQDAGYSDEQIRGFGALLVTAREMGLIAPVPTTALEAPVA